MSIAEETKCRPWSSPASSKSLLFYKLMVASIIHDKKLRIPDKLAKKIGDELSSVATLSVPNGRVWCVELTKIGNKIWFDTGWHEFLEHYSICEGHFLVLSYQGGSNFNINLFDLTTSEINYASKTLGYCEELTHGKQCPVPHKEGLTGHDPTEILDLTSCSTPSSLKNKVFDQCVDQQTPSENRPSLRNLIKVYEECVFGFNKEGRNAASIDGTKEDGQHLIKNPQNSQASIPFIRDVCIKSSEVKFKNSVDKTTEQRLHLANDGLYLQARFRFTRDIGIQFSESELTKSTDEIGFHLQGEAKQIFKTSKRQTRRTEPSEHEPSAKRIKKKEMNGIKANSRVSTRTRAVTPHEKLSAINAAMIFKEQRDKSKKERLKREICIPEGSQPELYTEEHDKLLGECKMTWTLCVDGYEEKGKRIYDPVNGETCHQCRQKTLGCHTHCSICDLVQGQLCGDCLYMRYGENVIEAIRDSSWICPVCRGICNCSLCRKAKGWAPTGNLYRKVVNLGFKSVAHYLIQTRRSQPNSKDPNAENSISMNESSALACGSVSLHDEPLEEDEGPDVNKDDKIEVEDEEEVCLLVNKHVGEFSNPQSKNENDPGMVDKEIMHEPVDEGIVICGYNKHDDDGLG